METTMAKETTLSAIELSTELASAWLSNQNNRVAAEDVSAFLCAIHTTVTQMALVGSEAASSDEDATPARDFVPAVTPRKSLASKDHIISMIDGKPYKTLRRHLSSNGLTPEQYRERYKLKADYPMVAESYSEARRAMAHRIGLGQRGRRAKALAIGPKAKLKSNFSPG